LDWILSFFVSLDDQIARISRMKASIFFVIRARSGPRFCSRQIPLKNVTIKPAIQETRLQNSSGEAGRGRWCPSVECGIEHIFVFFGSRVLLGADAYTTANMRVWR
jgi:hypothetical protein